MEALTGVWKTVNPAAGDFRSLDEMRTLCTEAKQSPSLENAFRRLYLNQRTQQEVRWMPMHAWDLCGPAGGLAMPDPKALEGRRCVAGLDLSQVLDLTACALIFPMEGDEKQHQVLMQFWIPEAMIAKRQDYQAWAGRGLVRVCPGETIDYGIVRKDIQGMAKFYQIDEIAYDPWNSTMLTGLLANEDNQTVRPVGQSTRELGAPMQELMRLVLAREINHGGNEVLRSCADAVIVVSDVYGNIRPSKKKSSAAGGDRIDGITALTLAIDALMRAPQGQPRITWIGE